MADLEQTAIERLRAASEMSFQHYKMPLIITDSGGKDSQVVKELALRSGIPFEIQHNHTTADAPETVRYIRQEAKRFEELGIPYTINLPVYKGQRTSMWRLIPQKLMPPTRLVRYCCAVLKEGGGQDGSSPPVCGGQKARPGRRTGAFTRRIARSSLTTTTTRSGCSLRIAG